MVLIKRGADELGITIKSNILLLSLDIGSWMVMVKDGSGNDAWYMYMTKSRLTQSYQSTIMMQWMILLRFSIECAKHLTC